MLIVGLLFLLLVLTELGLLRQLFRQSVTYKNYWTQAAQSPVPEGALRYVALGDSTAQGIGASRPERGYVGLLAGRLQKQTGRQVHITNLSVSGARTQDLIDVQLPELQKLTLPADAVVTLAIGSNDILGYQPDKFRVAMERVLSSVPSQTVVADIPYFGGGRRNPGEKSASEASVVIAELSKKYNLRLVQLHQATRKQHSIRNYAADFFHPNNRAYRIWADTFWQIMEADRQ